MRSLSRGAGCPSSRGKRAGAASLQTGAELLFPHYGLTPSGKTVLDGKRNLLIRISYEKDLQNRRLEAGHASCLDRIYPVAGVLCAHFRNTGQRPFPWKGSAAARNQYTCTRDCPVRAAAQFLLWSGFFCARRQIAGRAFFLLFPA